MDDICFADTSHLSYDVKSVVIIFVEILVVAVIIIKIRVVIY